MQAWSHIQLFSPWEFNTDPAARRLLAAAGWEEPDASALPTGGDLVKQYLQPLAELPALASHVRYGAEVTAISRLGIDRLRTADRDAAPFVLRMADGEEVLARAVIDASGTWRQPNHVGANGLPAHGEKDAAAWINHGLPDVFGADRDQHAGRHTVVVGAATRQPTLCWPWRSLPTPHRAPPSPGPSGAPTRPPPSAVAVTTSCPHEAPSAPV